MEEHEKELLQKLASSNVGVRRLYNEHVELESKLDSLQSRPFLTASDQMQIQKLKKKKLKGKDQLMSLLQEHIMATAS